MNQSLDAQLQATLNVIPAFAWVAAPCGGLQFVNTRCADYLGLSADHSLRLGTAAGAAWDSHIAFVHPDDHDEARRIWSTSLSSGVAGEVNLRLRNSQGHYRWFLSRAEPLRDTGGALLSWIGINFDIDERKQVEIELRRATAHAADAQKLTRTGFVGLEVSTNRILWSDEAARIYGYPPGTEPTAERILQRCHPDDLDLVRDSLERARRGESSFNYEHRLLMPDGSIKHLHDIAHLVTDDAGNDEVLGAIVDITERKLAAAAVRRSEAYLAEAQRLSHTGSFGWNVSSGEIFWSEETFQIFGCDPSATPTLALIFSRVHPDDRPLVQQHLDRARDDRESFDFEHRLQLPDGSVKQVRVTAHPSHRTTPGVEFVGAITDTTQQRQAEDRIREQETELRQILDLTPQLIAVFGPRRERLFANRMALDYFGQTLDQWRNTSHGALGHPDDTGRLRLHWDGAMSTGAAFEVEVRMRRDDGIFRWFLNRFNALRDHQGQVLRWYVACVDIEGRKQAEERLQQENVALREEIDKTSMFEEIVGASPALTAVLARVSKVAGSDSTVLITGETGTGKELVARAIHRRSRRASRAFVAVNCAAIPRDLITSELFGHEKGAFTGAIQRRIGRFELADGGTIFLDEVGELAPDIQVALLRVVQEREFERVGGRDRIRVDVRILAATNRDLSAAVASGTFRQDLFYRLNVFPLDVPPLRERREDIPVLVEYFIARYAGKTGKTFRRVAKRTLDRLRFYPWPGNVRELQNVIERSVIVSDTDEFTVDESWLSTPAQVESRNGLSGALAAHEKAIVEAALRATGGRIFGPAGAAARLGVPRSTLESKIRALRINKSRFRARERKGR
jgi:PAS domain S-box-containing protein